MLSFNLVLGNQMASSRIGVIENESYRLMSEEKTQGGVQSLEVGLGVLDALIAHRNPMMLKELAEALTMHQAWRLGLQCIQRTDVIQAAQPYIQALHREIHCGLQISRWTSQGPLIVQFIEPDQPVSVITRVGSIMPLLNSATGRAFASFMPENMVRPLLEREWQNKQQQGVQVYPANWNEFLEMKQGIVLQGAATVSGDMLVGVNSFCVPVFNSHGDIEFCIAALGNEAYLPMDFEHEKVRVLKATAQALTDFVTKGQA